MELTDWVMRASEARRLALLALSGHESAKSRIIHLDVLIASLSGAPIDVQDYFKEAVMCIEHELYRLAIVTAWTGYFHTFSETLFSRHEKDIRVARDKWEFRDLAELKENHPESQLLDVAKEVRFINKSNLKVLQGQLSQRNQCAHPTAYRPTMNIAIGYIEELIQRTRSYITP